MFPEHKSSSSTRQGIHKSDTLFNRRMMDTVRGALEERDLVLFVVDVTKPVTEEDEHAVSALHDTTRAFLVLNKIDRLEDKRAAAAPDRPLPEVARVLRGAANLGHEGQGRG